MRASVRDLLLLVSGLTTLAGVCLGTFVVISGFEESYAPFGADLDRPLRWLFASYRWFALALVPAALLWLGARSSRAAARRTATYCFVVALVLAAISWWAVQPRTLCCDLSGLVPTARSAATG